MLAHVSHAILLQLKSNEIKMGWDILTQATEHLPYTQRVQTFQKIYDRKCVKQLELECICKSL